MLIEQTDLAVLNSDSNAGPALTWHYRDITIPVVITRLIIDITIRSGQASTYDFGSTAANSGDKLIDGLNTYTVGTFDNIMNKGTNGRTCLRLEPGEDITSSQATGSVAGLQGFAYITYLLPDSDG